MKFNIEHTTRFAFNKPIGYSIQQLRLTPQDGFGQRVSQWQIKVNGGTSEQFDAFGNTTHTLVLDTPHKEITISALGVVETDLDWPTSANAAKSDELALPIFLRNTELTQISDQIIQFSQQFVTPNQAASRAQLMSLMHGISQSIVWNKKAAENQQSAVATLAAGEGLSQGFAHLFISCCRALKVPARFVHGYCYNHASKQLEHHSWADAWLLETGWQSFDVVNDSPSNGIHVRLATGLDYRDACPITSMMGNDQMSVDFKVQAMMQQQ